MLTLHCAQVLRSAAEFTSGHSERISSKTTPELSGHYKSHKTAVMCDLTVVQCCARQCSSSHCLLALQDEEEEEEGTSNASSPSARPSSSSSSSSSALCLIIIDLVKQLCLGNSIRATLNYLNSLYSLSICRIG